MRTALTVAATALLCLCVTAADANPPEYPCFRAEVAPEIDGDGGDACWQGAPLATGFSILGGGFTDAKQTAFRLCWDEAALYYLIVCEEPDVGHLRTDVRDGGPGWLNDGAEIFVQPGGEGQVYQFVVTAAAARAAGAGAPDWREVEAAAARGDRSYTLEIAIPHDAVRAEPDVEDAWSGAVCRNIWTTNSGGDKFTSWPALNRQFLEPENYATIAFRGTSPGGEAVGALTGELNHDYRDHLVGQLRAVAERGPIYRPVLERARQSEELGSRARRLLYRWYRLERVQSDPKRFTLQQLRDMVQSAEALEAESYEVKYAHLIDGLFPD